MRPGVMFDYIEDHVDEVALYHKLRLEHKGEGGLYKPPRQTTKLLKRFPYATKQQQSKLESIFSDTSTEKIIEKILNALSGDTKQAYYNYATASSTFFYMKNYNRDLNQMWSEEAIEVIPFLFKARPLKEPIKKIILHKVKRKK